MSLLIDSDFRQKTRDAINQPPQMLKQSVGDDRQYANNLIFQLFYRLLLPYLLECLWAQHYPVYTLSLWLIPSIFKVLSNITMLMTPKFIFPVLSIPLSSRPNYSKVSSVTLFACFTKYISVCMIKIKPLTPTSSSASHLSDP